jgi:toxin YoeB
MRFVFTPNGWEDYVFWQTTDRATLKRINRLLDDIASDPFAGIGKPEQLRHALAGAWSRRIDEEHRIVYLVEGHDIVILQSRYHYT